MNAPKQTPVIVIGNTNSGDPNLIAKFMQKKNVVPQDRRLAKEAVAYKKPDMDPKKFAEACHAGGAMIVIFSKIKSHMIAMYKKEILALKKEEEKIIFISIETPSVSYEKVEDVLDFTTTLSAMQYVDHHLVIDLPFERKKAA
jgi:hypothetical protein